MDRKDITIATMTWARDSVEGSLLRESLQQLAGLNVPVFICDGGSGNDFIDFLKSFPQFTLVPREGSGVWSQVTTSVRAAYESGSEYIFYTEPDKLDFFRKSLSHFFEDAVASEKLGVFLAARSREAFETFPAFQRATETAINNCCSEIIGKSLDYTYGPFLFNRSLASSLELVHQDIGWGWRPYIFAVAKRLDFDVRDYIGDFVCPVDQRQDDAKERIYRMKQLRQNIDGLLVSEEIRKSGSPEVRK